MLRRRELALIRRAKRGDAEAIEGLIKAHQVSLYHFMLRMTGRPETAEDIAQEAFVRVLRNLARFDEKYRFSTWLYTIARRLWINEYQKCKPTFDSDIVGSASSSGLGPEQLIQQDVDRETASDAVEVALSALSTRQQEIILLYYSCGCSIQEVALRQNLPQGTVKSHLFRARARMATVLEQSGFDMPEYSGSGQS
jgi:RNA polymerase sigma-70 factor (ECF subfamily)